MKWLMALFLLISTSATAAETGSDIRVLSIAGTIAVRHGTDETWAPLAAGDELKPEDSIELQEGSSAALLLPGGRRVEMSRRAIVNISDLRVVSQEDLLLLLAMEQVRSIPDRRPGDGIPAAATTIHGTSAADAARPFAADPKAGLLELRGAEWLYENGYFATCILRVKSTLRVYPTIPGASEARLMAADAMERAGVPEEALAEYRSLLGGSALTPEQHRTALAKVAGLEKKN